MKREPTFFERERRQRILLIVFFVIIFIWLSVLLRQFKIPFFSLPKVETFYPQIEELKLNLDILENPKLKNLEPFPQIEIPKQEEIGKENPFSP